jgi:hypothetical protein
MEQTSFSPENQSSAMFCGVIQQTAAPFQDFSMPLESGEHYLSGYLQAPPQNILDDTTTSWLLFESYCLGGDASYFIQPSGAPEAPDFTDGIAQNLNSQFLDSCVRLATPTVLVPKPL